MIRRLSWILLVSLTTITGCNFIDSLLDPERPKLTLLSPANGSEIETEQIEVEGTATDNREVTALGYQVNNQPRKSLPITKAFKFTVPVVLGENTITVFASDGPLNEVSVSVKIVRFTVDEVELPTGNNTALVEPAAGTIAKLRLALPGNIDPNNDLEASIAPLDANYPDMRLDAPKQKPQNGAFQVRLTIPFGVLPQSALLANISVKHKDQIIRKSEVYVRIPDGAQPGLERANQYRVASKLKPVTEDLYSTAACWLHGRYQVMNNFVGHIEDPTLPGYTKAGTYCAANSNVAFGWHPTKPESVVTDRDFVDGFMTGPFHASGILDPGLAHTAVGVYRKARNDSSGRFFVSSGGVTILYGKTDTWSAAPFFFPGEGSTVELTSHKGEWPSPISVCGYSGTTGLPLFVMIGRETNTTASDAQLLEDGKLVTSCGYGSTQFADTVNNPGPYPDGLKTPTEVGRATLKGRGMAVVVPKEPLKAGSRYQVSLKVNGKPLEWSFNVSQTPTQVLSTRAPNQNWIIR